MDHLVLGINILYMIFLVMVKPNSNLLLHNILHFHTFLFAHIIYKLISIIICSTQLVSFNMHNIVFQIELDRFRKISYSGI